MTDRQFESALRKWFIGAMDDTVRDKCADAWLPALYRKVAAHRHAVSIAYNYGWFSK